MDDSVAPVANETSHLLAIRFDLRNQNVDLDGCASISMKLDRPEWIDLLRMFREVLFRAVATWITLRMR